MHHDDHGTEYSFDSISGLSLDACAFLAYRREPRERPRPSRMESWIVEPSASDSIEGERMVSLELGLDGFLTGLWCSTGGNVYATDFHGRLFVHYYAAGDPIRRWSRFDAGEDVELHHVFGLDDQHVYVLGRDAFRRRMWTLTGDGLVPMPAPGGRATLLRGLAHDLLYAAGDRGFLAQWNGRRWRTIRLPLERSVTGLSVTDPDELWLTADNGKLFEGTSHGWALRTQLDGPLYDVASWRGDVFLAAGPRGLLKLGRTTRDLETVNTSIAPVGLDARGKLLALTRGALVSMTDDLEPTVTCRQVLRAARGEHTPRWREGGS